MVGQTIARAAQLVAQVKGKVEPIATRPKTRLSRWSRRPAATLARTAGLEWRGCGCLNRTLLAP